MKKTRIAMALAFASLAATVAANAHDQSKHSNRSKTGAVLPHAQTADEGEAPYLESDKLFLWRVHWINHSEIQAGDQARTQSASEEIADFGDKLVQDHRQLESDLVMLAKDKNIELQLTSDEYRRVREPLARQMTESMDLGKLKGAEFDRPFLTHMTDAHLAAIDLMRTYRAKTSDADIRAFIDSGLATIQEHHRIAESLLAANRSERQDVSGIEPKEKAGKKEKKNAKGTSSSSKTKKKLHDEPEQGTDKQEDLEQDVEERLDPTDGPIDDRGGLDPN